MNVDILDTSQAIETEILEPEVITIEVLLSGGASQIIALPSKYRFTTTSARDAYFAAYPSELVSQLFILVGDALYQYLNNQWISMVSVVTGPAGASFRVAGELSSEASLPDPSYAPSNEAYLVNGFEDGSHLFILVDGAWSDQGALSGVQGPKGDTGLQGPKGDPGETPRFRIDEHGHLIAVYQSDISEVTNVN